MGYRESKRREYVEFAVIAAIVFMVMISLFKCSKNSDIAQDDIKSKMDSIEISKPSNDKLMNPGADPKFVNYIDDSYELNNILKRGIMIAAASTWERFMYVDKTDTFYTNMTGVNTFGRYLRTYGFTGIYSYDTRSILSSTGNYSKLGTYLRTLSSYGVTKRGVVKDSGNDFGPTGKVTLFNNSQIDPNSKFNVANLELEWWIVSNNIPFPTWNTTNKSVASGSISENDFYFGWYKNMGGVIDTIGSKDQVRYSDKILEHCYQNGYPTYSYANAQSLGATGGRLDILAKGARQEYLRTGIMKKANIYIIISAENMANGDANTFTGPKLLAAANQPNPFQYVENQAYTNIYGGMTAFQKQWLNLKGFVWFTKRCCYNAVKPK